MDLLRSAINHCDPSAGQRLCVFGEVVVVKAVAADTGGAYALFEIETAPGHGIPLHLQRYDDKAFYVLEGMYAFQIGSEFVQLDPGSLAFAPRGTAHRYTNTGRDPARLLLLVSPGGVLEHFFAELDGSTADADTRRSRQGLTDRAWVAMVAEKYGIELLSWLSPSPLNSTPDSIQR